MMDWHYEGCTGKCIACLIEEVVKENCGQQGLDYLLRVVNSRTDAVVNGALDQAAEACERLISGDGICAADGVWVHDCAAAIRALKE